MCGSGVGRSTDTAYAQAEAVGPGLVPYIMGPHEQTVSVLPMVVCKIFEQEGGECICAKYASWPPKYCCHASASSR